MCTLVAFVRLFPGLPLVVAANRDERLDRAASPPRAWPGESFVAPRDEVAGGTWLGVTTGGMFVGVTNRFGVPRDAARASRGTLVIEALRAPSVKALHGTLAATPAHRFNAFHLLYADAEASYVTWSDGEALKQEELMPGLHVVTERSLGGDDRDRTERVRAWWSERAKDPARAPAPEDLMGLLRQHAAPDAHPLGGLCVHADALGYGTRSSMVLYLAESRAASRLFWAEGHPCTSTYEDRSALLCEG